MFFPIKIMERPRKEESFEVGEFSVEVLNEWYAEREPVVAETESKPDKTEEAWSSENRVPETEERVSEEQEKKDSIKGKIKELLDIGEKKGLVYAIERAKRSNDPFLLDVFHDILAKDGNYKKILKK